jgi:hypothetical protein
MKIALTKQMNNSFIASYDSDYDKVKKLKQGEVYFFEVKQERNIKFHIKFFALIKMIFENQEHYDNSDILRGDLIVSAGYYDEHTTVWGEVRKEPKSISFASMDEEEFGKLYSAVLDEIVKHFNFDKQEIIDNVEQYF